MSYRALALLNLGGGEILLILVLLLVAALGVAVVGVIVCFAARGSPGKAGSASRRATPTPSLSAQPPDFEQQLRTLAKLRDEGVITEEDFNAKKKTLLGI